MVCMEELGSHPPTPTSSSIKSVIDMSVPKCHFQEGVQQSGEVRTLAGFDSRLLHKQVHNFEEVL